MKGEVIAMGKSQAIDITEAEELVSPRSMKVAATLQRKGGEEFAKPGKLVEVRFVKGQSLSLAASRLFALMVLSAGGDAWRDMRHRLRKSPASRRASTISTPAHCRWSIISREIAPPPPFGLSGGAPS